MTPSPRPLARDGEPKLKRYIVTVEGYADEQFDAVSGSAARYRAFVAFCDATKRMPFKEFLQRVHAVHLGKVT